MDRETRDRLWSLTVTGASVMTAYAVRSMLEATWKKYKHEDPPKNPASSDVDWKDAVAWTLATGVVVGLSKLVVKRWTASGWKKITGDTPPEID